ncbi:hypothetical protein RND71_007172 [Anisodus tanguticus]|uniref:Uncharacterized protein n=1 Tax=Anisodus tanguticus TaxID=243964 RepID=A0AAE1SIK8_9SOLA|nr:hypothetical protein RND71_007172 [Anisodus tanguticus]
MGVGGLGWGRKEMVVGVGGFEGFGWGDNGGFRERVGGRRRRKVESFLHGYCDFSHGVLEKWIICVF